MVGCNWRSSTVVCTGFVTRYNSTAVAPVTLCGPSRHLIFVVRREACSCEPLAPQLSPVRRQRCAASHTLAWDAFGSRERYGSLRHSSISSRGPCAVTVGQRRLPAMVPVESLGTDGIKGQS